MEKVKVSLVSYLNSKPFAFGLLHSVLFNSIILSLDHPAICAEKLITNKVDIGLVPVASLNSIQNASIISDYCIGASGIVSSVLLVSSVPLEEIKLITLDHESRTSVLLAKILAKEFWSIEPLWRNENADEFSKISGTSAAVVIGDRALKMRGQFKYVYDLSEEWQKMTNLPFVFACWVANKKIEQAFLELFNEALKFGVENIDQLSVVENLSIFEKNYLENSIHYRLTEKMKEGLDLFLSLTQSVK